MNPEDQEIPLTYPAGVPVLPAQSRPGSHIAPPESIDHEHSFTLDHLWSDDSDLRMTLDSAHHLRHLSRSFYNDAASYPLVLRLKTWYRVLNLMDKEKISQDEHVMIIAHLDEINQVLNIRK